MIEFNIHPLPIYRKLAPVLSTRNIEITKLVYAHSSLGSSSSIGYLSPQNEDLFYFSTYP